MSVLHSMLVFLCT